MKWVKRGVMILVVVAIVGAIAYGFMPKPVPSEFARATRGDVRVSIDEEGFTRVKDRFDVSAPTAGDVSRITLKAGDTVEVGTVITVLTPGVPMLLDARAKAQAEANVKVAAAAVKQAEANVDNAKAQLELATKEFDNLVKLKSGSQVSKESVDAAETRKDAAAAALRSAEFGKQAAGFQLEMAQAGLLEDNEDAELHAIEIRSPVAGRVLRVYRESAGVVQPGEMLLEIGDPNSLEIVVDLLSSDAVRVKPGMPVSIERWGGDEPLKGVVRYTEPQGFTKVSSLGVDEQRVNVIIDFRGEPQFWSRLGDQFRVEARVITRERNNVVKIPSGALFNAPDGQALFVVANGKAQRRLVEVGERNGLEAEILDKLNEGDMVIVHPSDEIEDGTRVEAR